MTDNLELDPEADDQKLLAQVVAYYHRTLKNSSETLGHLQSQGLANEQFIGQFRVGYADRTLGKQLPCKQLKAGRLIRGRLQQLGLFRTSGHEHFNGCVVFPILAADGTERVVDMYGRKLLAGRLPQRCQCELYLGPQRQGVWNIAAFAAAEEIILCPSLFDALSFWLHGYRNVTCTFGADALSEDHLAAFREFKRIRRVLVVAERIVPALLQAGLDCYRLALPHDLTVHAYAMAVAEPADALGDAIRKAEWLGHGQPPCKPMTTTVSSPNPSAQEPATPETIAETTSPIRTASPLPPAPPDIDVDVHEDEVRVNLGERHYRVRGWTKNLSFDQLRVNVLVSQDQSVFVDTFDRYAAKHRRAFVVQAAQELGMQEQVIKTDLGRLLLKLEELQDQHIAQSLAPRESKQLMSAAERDDALRLLRDPRLLDRIVADCNIVGERTNKLAGYLAAISRKLDEPLAVIIQSSSAAGKTALMDALLALVPPEDHVKYSAVTGQALFYMGETSLQHKILAIVEEQGGQRTCYALKLLQSEGELRIASTGKEGSSGQLVTREYRVQGPVMILLTTTAIKIDEELLNGCLVLTVDEGREQTRAIHQAQRRQQTLEGVLAKQDRLSQLTLHCNAQRLLRPLLVVNPFAETLTFADDKPRTRRDHAKYLTLIRAVALLHQYQRPVKTIDHHGRKVEYIEVGLDDIAIANQLAREILGRSLDELPPQTRRLLCLIDEMVTAACQRQGVKRTDYRFTRRDVHEFTAWGHTQLKVHLRRLEELEYLLVHRGPNGRSFVYELLYETAAGDEKFLCRLIDVDELRCERSASNGLWSGGNEPKSGCGRGQVGPESGAGRPGENGVSTTAASDLPPADLKNAENAREAERIPTIKT